MSGKLLVGNRKKKNKKKMITKKQAPINVKNIFIVTRPEIKKDSAESSSAREPTT